ncbi:MAG: FtsX-like permease family protein [Luteitalea sp.]|nr:FtsX-like permease family protein [Luteitalea sp.]
MHLERWLHAVPLRLRSLFRRRRVEAELDEEIRDHLEQQVAEHIARGSTLEEARSAALRAIGGVEQRKEECRDARRVNIIEQTMQDLRYATRTLRANPGFTAVALLSLALGIGANTAIFQLLDAVRLRSLPVANPQELTEVQVPGSAGLGLGAGNNAEVTNPLWEEIRQHQRAFAGIFAWGNDQFPLGQGTEARSVRVLWVSGELFSVLGVTPARGRLFRPDDDRRGCQPAGIVVSHALWQKGLGGQGSAIGRRVTIGNERFEVIGVTPATFFGLEVGKSFDVALPLCAQALWGDILDRRDVWWLRVIGRVRPDWTLTQASEHVAAISPGLFEATALTGYTEPIVEKYRELRLEAVPAATGVSALRRTYDTALWLLLGMTALILLIACANLGNLMLARATAREREFAVRLALGASRGRLVRQLLAESLLLAIIGAAFAVGLARASSKGIVWLLSTGADAVELDLTLDWRVLAFTAAVAMLACVIFGLIPALRSSRTEPGSAMKAGGQTLTAGRERRRFQRMLVVSQIAVSLVLLVGALLFMRTFHNLVTLDPGFRQDGVVVAFVSLAPLDLPKERREPFKQQMLARVQASPLVKSAATTTNAPLSGSIWSLIVRVAGASGERTRDARFTWVSPEYLETMEIALLTGRNFDRRDTAQSPRVVLVNETFADTFLAGDDPIGKTVRTNPEPNYPETAYEIVGVVRDTKYADLRDEIPPIAFIPASQHPSPELWTAMLIRSSAPTADVVAAVRQRVGELAPEVTLEFHVLQTRIRQSLVRERLMAALSAFFGIVAVALATIGLYGVLSYVVVRRRNEMGVRLALGARPYQVVRLVMQDAGSVLAIGLVAGFLLSLLVWRSAGALLYGLEPHDPSGMMAAAGVLTAVAALASYLPARRAARVDPVTALRHE